MKTKILIGTVVLCGTAAWAAEFDVRPGLWDMTTTTQMSGLPPIPNFDQIPAEQRARIEAAMKNVTGPHTNTTKTCVTKEGIEKAIAQASSNSRNKCDPKIVSMTASKVVMHIECTPDAKNAAKTSGDMTLERQDPEHVTGTGTMKSTGSGHTMDIKWTMTGKFVSAECGNVKPEGQ